MSLEERAGVEAIKQALPPRSSCATCQQPSLNIRNSVACLSLLQLGSMSLYRYNRFWTGAKAASFDAESPHLLFPVSVKACASG